MIDTPACFVVVIALVVACRPEPRRPVVAPAPVDPELVRTLAVLATSRSPSPAEVEQIRQRIDRGELTLPAYIDSLLASDAFVSDVAPLVILRQLMSQGALGAPEGWALSHTDGPDPIYYLEEPCKPEQAVSVQPWWNLIDGKSDAVKICPDAYKPEQWTVNVVKGEPETSCWSEAGQSEPHGCGCGPNLLRCFTSQAQRDAFSDSLRDELRLTIAHEIAGDRPLEEIFTSNATFRDRNAEYQMRLYTAEAARRPVPEAALRELAAWPQRGKWAPREDLAPGENAGILTSPELIHYQLDRRQRMTALYDILWCDEPSSIGATPQSVLSIAGPDLQLKSAGWRDLAARPICTGCHARLDYGMQFFWGFANGNIQAYFVPQLQQTGRGPLYGRDIDDPRGEAELDPRGFAQLAVAQPEFGHCMARDFAEYVLGDQVTPAQIAKVEHAFRPGATPGRELMRVALRVLVDTWPARRAAPAAPLAPPPPSGRRRGQVAVTGELHALLDAHCLDCHDHQAGRPDLGTPQLDDRTVAAMLDDVSAGTMPKDQPLGERDRRAFLEAFIAATWTGADAEAARGYFVDRATALASYRPEVAFALIHHIANASGKPSWRMMESSVRPNLQQVSPGMITVTGLEAIEACRKTSTTRAERERCIDHALELQNLSHPP